MQSDMQESFWIFFNAMARMFDLMPFVAIGYSIDYFTKIMRPKLLQDFVTALPVK